MDPFSGATGTAGPFTGSSASTGAGAHQDTYPGAFSDDDDRAWQRALEIARNIGTSLFPSVSTSLTPVPPPPPQSGGLSLGTVALILGGVLLAREVL